jgi:hypothetical protein
MRVLWFSTASILRAMIHTDLQLNINIIRKTSGQNLQTFKKQNNCFGYRSSTDNKSAVTVSLLVFNELKRQFLCNEAGTLMKKAEYINNLVCESYVRVVGMVETSAALTPSENLACRQVILRTLI